MPCAPLLMLDSPGGTGCNGVCFPFHGGWICRDVRVLFNTYHTYTNNETNQEILHILSKGPKLNTTEQYKLYNHYKQSPTNILNDQLYYKTHTLFDTITHARHTNISANPITMNWKMNSIETTSTGTKWFTWHRKASAKNSSK